MSIETFFEHFELLAEAPGGVKRLREMILQFAVMGKLVEQDPNDEPASVLLERIRDEKERLAKEGKLKKGKQSLPVTSNERFMQSPQSWLWIRLQELGEFGGGSTPSMTRSDFWNGSIPWVSPKDMKSDQIAGSELQVTEKAIAETNLRLIPRDSLLVVARSGILKRMLPVSINSVECTVNQDIKVITPYISGLTPYLQLMLKGFEGFILKHLVKTGTTVQSLKYEEFEKQCFPLPPLAEQQRIVAKVDQLMALCDDLEERQRRRREQRLALNTTAIDRLLEARDPEELALHWQRLRDNFDLLYDTPETVQKLRQAILQLAVMGKLVPQDPNDEPVRGLKLPSKDLSVASYQVPDSWRWVKFEDILVELKNGYFGGTPEDNPPGVPILRISSVRPRSVSLENFRYLRVNENEVENYYLQDHDLLFTRYNGSLELVGVCGLVRNLKIPMIYPDKLIRARILTDLASHEYLEVYFASIFLRNIVENKARTTAGQKGIAGRDIKSLPVVVPPLAEQRRIVARVDQLMALCDELEERLKQGQAQAERLAEAIASRLLERDEAEGGAEEREPVELERGEGEQLRLW